MIIRPLEGSDWAAVRQIYIEGIETGQATFETSAPSWETWDAGHLETCRFVADFDGVVAGWSALSAVSRRAVYRGVCEVSVYVAAAWRGRGVGRVLMRALVDASEAAGIWTLQSSVFPENSASLRLHREVGFREVGRRDRIAQLAGVWRDTVLLERRSSAV